MRKSFIVAGVLAIGASAHAQAFFENFDDITTLSGKGWAIQNNSELSDVDANVPWVQGCQDLLLNPTMAFPAHSGGVDSYISASWDSTDQLLAPATISNWLMTPQTMFNNGDTFSFWTRTTTVTDLDTGDVLVFPDRLELRMSTSGASTNVGIDPTDVGDFTNLMLTINPNLTPVDYPFDWTQFSATVSGLSGPTSGRLAFRYWVTDGGILGSNSAKIGIDDAQFSPVPEPAALAVLGVGCLALIRRRRGTRRA